MIKKVRIILAIFLVVILLVTGLAGCTGDSKNSGSDSKLSSQSSDDFGLLEKGKIIMGTNAEFPPFEFVEGDGYAGIDVDMMTEIAKRMGLDLVIENMKFDSLPSSIKSKKIDVVVAGLSIDPDREDTYDFSDPYYEGKQSIIVKADSGYTSKEDIKGKIIGGQTGNTGIVLFATDVTEEQNIKGYNNGASAVDALIGGDVDAVIVDDGPAKEYKNIHGDKITLIENQFDPESYAIGVADGNKVLLGKINEILKELKADGTFEKIVNKYKK